MTDAGTDSGVAAPSTMTDAEEVGKLRWRCRRGMKELDVLLSRYLDLEYARASAAQRHAFRELLDAQDPVIYAYLLGQRAPDGALAALIARITASPSNATLPNDR